MIIERDPRVGSQVYVVATPGELTMPTRLVVTLNGAIVCTAEYVTTHGKSGTALTYRAAICVGGSKARPREWWASTQFREQQRVAYALLQHFSLQAKSVWREQLDYVAFAAAVNANMRGPRRQHRPLQAIGLVTESQILTLEPRPESMFCLTSLLEKFVEVDATASALGVCGA